MFLNNSTSVESYEKEVKTLNKCTKINADFENPANIENKNAPGYIESYLKGRLSLNY